MDDNHATPIEIPSEQISPTRLSLLALASTYFISFAALGLMFPFLPLILHGKGLSDAEIALAMAMSGVSSLIAPNLFAHIADRFLSCRRLLPLLFAGNALALLLLTKTTTFLDSSIAIFLLFSSLVPSLSMLESFTLDIVKNQPISAKPITFQSYRIWGSIGFIAPACLMGVVPTWRSLTAYELLIIGISASMATACVALILPNNTPQRHNPARPLYAAIKAAWQPSLRGVILANAIAGMGLATFFIAFPRFLHELKFSAVQIGLITNIGVVSEILMMPFIAYYVARVGLKALVIIGFASIPLRLFIIAFHPSQTTVLLTQILHGPLVIGVFVALPMYLQEHADNSFRHSLQNLNVTLSHGIARCVGPALAAAYFANSQLPQIEQLTTAFVGIGALGLIAMALCTRPRERLSGE